MLSARIPVIVWLSWLLVSSFLSTVSLAAGYLDRIHFSCSTMAESVFSITWNLVLQDVALFLGGTYVLLGVTAFCLFYRRKAGGRAVFMCAIAVMLCLAIIELVMQIIVTSSTLRLLFLAGTQAVDSALFLRQQVSLEHQFNIVGFVEDLVLVTNNAIADGLFAYRCYLIWGPPFNKQVICLPILLLVKTTVLGYVTVYRNDLSHPGTHIMDSRIGFIFAIVTNLVLTGLTAGRIWCTRRQFRTLVGEKTAIRRYTNAISVLLESGAAYTLSLVLVILALTFGRTATSGPSAIFPSIAYGAARQLVNIVPTVFIVTTFLFVTPEYDAMKDSEIHLI